MRINTIVKTSVKTTLCLALLGFMMVALFMGSNSPTVVKAVSLDDDEAMAGLGLNAIPLNVSETLGNSGLKRFVSYDELKEFAGKGIPIWSSGMWPPSYYYQGSYALVEGSVIWIRNNVIADASSEFAWEGAPDYSGNIMQVEGVYEADIVKTDGKYIYIVLEDKIVIVEAFPAEQAEVLCEIALEGSLEAMYINGDRLVIFETVFQEQTVNTYTTPEDTLEVEISVPFHPYRTNIKVYDVSERETPVLDQEVAVDGQYWDSRMIGDYVYVVVSEQIYSWEEEIFVPGIHIGDTALEVPATDILHPEKADTSYKFTTVIALDVNKGIHDTQDLGYGMFLLESNTAMYVSQGNLYFACTRYNNDDHYLNSMIHRIDLEGGELEYHATGEVPGTVLNQFSMDEYLGHFRVVTTVNCTKHNVYILDENLDITGQLEDFAPQGERFHSARFMGGRCYLVTFRNTDPLFVIDLSDPYLPEVLGELKITGYSDYLRSYDENHLIGIGKEATSSGLFQGVKISLFDISDGNDPKEIAKYEIGGRGTESPVLDDHKALLFDRDKNLLVMPVLVVESWQHIYQGAYVFHISPEEGIKLEGTITHCEDEDDLKGSMYSPGESWVQRCVYIDNVLYTISDTKIVMNDLENLDQVGEILLP